MGEIFMFKDQSGFALSEVLIAVLILGLVAALFGSVFGSSIQSIWGAGNHHAALTEAQSLLERALVDDSLAEADGVLRDPVSLPPGEQEGELITVRIPWISGFGSERFVELSVFTASPQE
jgi:prepilin-type N-terminal cleavage/methylation domain-containing protein